MKRLLPLAIISLSLFLIQVGSEGHVSVRPNPVSRFKTLSKQLFDFTRTNGYNKAIPLYERAAMDAKAAGDTYYSIRFLNNLGGCQIGIFQFQAALKTLLEAKALGEKTGDRVTTASLNSNISSLFQQMGNLPEAVKAAEEAVRHAGDLEDVPRASMYTQLGNMLAEMGHPGRAEDAYAKAIDIALNAPATQPGALDTLAWAWDSLGYARRKAGNIEQAETAATEGFRLRTILHLGAIDSSYMNLGAIRASQGDLPSAIRLMDEAEKAIGSPRSATPAWRIYMERGRIELGAGQLEAALRDLRRSRELARDWRIDVVANDANRTSSEVELAELYQYLIQAGNRLYLASHDEALIRETFEAAEENRAASLRALLPQHSNWRNKLTPRYYVVLAKLKATETAGLAGGSPLDTGALTQLRSDLDQMEARAGAEAPNEGSAPLAQAIQSLDGNSALFSFELGDSESWLWTVTENGLSVHRVAPRKELADKIREFENAIQGNKVNLAALGGELYRSLFGAVEPEAIARKRWILLLDRELFELPFPALSPQEGRYLIEDHSLQIASSALMLKASGQSGGLRHGFLGVGDPIYNLADVRAKEGGGRTWPSILTGAPHRPQVPALARLWGTGREIDVSAQTWNLPPSVLLKGKDASPENFWAATEAKPDIIHFATHIVDGIEEPRTGWIALSLGGSGQVQYITPADILARAISARLVILSGCSSGKGDAPTATGLMGLTRAWIAAGAGSVLATRWPTVDDDGAFFQAFYRHLRRGDDIDPTEALRRASLEVLKTRTWRAAPSFWAGYFLVGNS